MTEPALVVEELSVGVRDAGSAETSRLLSGISFQLRAGRTTCLVGATGSGKTLLALALLGMADDVGAAVETGQVLLGERDLLQLSDAELSRVRGAQVAFVPQEAGTALSPVHDLGWQIGHVARFHQRLSRRVARTRAKLALEQLGIPDADARVNNITQEVSTSLQKLTLLAMALINKPRVLIADEPTAALDAITQEHVLQRLKQAQREQDMATLIITHDLALVAEQADDVLVLHDGTIVESGDVRQIFLSPRSSYTRALLDARLLSETANVPSSHPARR